MVDRRHFLGPCPWPRLAWTIARSAKAAQLSRSSIANRMAQALERRSIRRAARGGTERPFTSPLLRSIARACSPAPAAGATCSTPRPSSTAARAGRASGSRCAGAVIETPDRSFLMARTAVCVQPLRRPSRPRLQRRTAAHRAPLLHERRRARVQAAGRLTAIGLSPRSGCIRQAMILTGEDLGALAAWRKALHRAPELSGREESTAPRSAVFSSQLGRTGSSRNSAVMGLRSSTTAPSRARPPSSAPNSTPCRSRRSRPSPTARRVRDARTFAATTATWRSSPASRARSPPRGRSAAGRF